MNEQLINLAILELPAVIARLKELFAKDNPDTPAPTDAEVIAAYEAAFQSSMEKDERWLASHPEPSA